MFVTEDLCPPQLLLCGRGVFCDLVYSHEEVDRDAGGSCVLVFPVLIP